jgi:hypothetical protein
MAEKMVRKYAQLERELVAEAADAREARNHWITAMRAAGTWYSVIALAAGMSVAAVARIADAGKAEGPDPLEGSGPGRTGGQDSRRPVTIS